MRHEDPHAGAVSSDDEVKQYGALPWRKDKHGSVQILLITSRRRGRWIVPKGWPVKGRASYMAAALEAFEEAGVIGEISSTELASYRYIKLDDGGSLQRRRVALFPLRVRGTLTNWPERSQRQRRWLPIAEAAELVDDTELARVISMIGADPRILTDPKQFRLTTHRSETPPQFRSRA